VILIVSNSIREAHLLAMLCEQRSWACVACTTISDFGKHAEKNELRAVVVRQRLQDGYSDDVLAFLKKSAPTARANVIVLVSAHYSIQQEARQVALGADCVMRDPIKSEVLLEYLAKYRSRNREAPFRDNNFPVHYEFAGAMIFPHEHRLVRQKRSIRVAPQEIELVRLLQRSVGKVASYPVLYGELFNQRFGGDTANCRVLLGKLTLSFRRLGINLRAFIEVIPKSGYLYSSDPKPSPSPHRKGRRARMKSSS
jgi:DNA-binding response OmpR family regulator